MNTPSREQIWEMFNNISPTYDRNNRILSFFTDKKCRKALAKHLPKHPIKLLDLATGTADQIIALMDTCDNIEQAIGIDPAEQMLKIGRKKILQKAYANRVSLLHGFSEDLPFEAKQFDVITIAFGIRNVQNINKTLQEARRVLKKRGLLMILEFGLPKQKWIRKMHGLYLGKCLPVLGGLLSGNFPAYRYLNQTIATFPYAKAFEDLLRQNQWHPVSVPLIFGSLYLYIATIDPA